LSSELYTFVLDFDGGTYIAQVEGPLQDACEAWLRGELGKIEALDRVGQQELIESISDEEPTLIDGLENVWCLSGVANGILALVHVVKTEGGAIQNPKSEIPN
jgi:hypothetical protein